MPVPEDHINQPIQPLGDVQSRYSKYMKDCFDYYQAKGHKGIRCKQTEQDRIDMSLRQPQSMRNYTTMGFTKIRAPDHVFELLQSFWSQNKDRRKLEQWPPGNIYTNHWEAPTYLVSVEDQSLEGGGYVLKQHIWNAARDTMEQWTGHKQAECSLYGIRVYTTGSMLAPHVDRNPLVSSAIINVDQDVDEPWPLEVIGHDGIARNVTMEPGDLVLYESHSVIHGRQFPLKGRFMANVFIHFEPVGPIGGPIEYDGRFPPYIIRGSPEESRWRSRYKEHKLLGKSFVTGSNDAHTFAANGEVESLTQFLNNHPDAINQKDKNGWTPLVEAVRKGDIETVRLLLDRGSEVNLRVGDHEQDGSLLWLAKHFHGENHPVVNLLKERGATVDEPPRRPSATSDEL